jgi:HK97 family phage portal protein
MGDVARMLAGTTTIPFSPLTYDAAFPTTVGAVTVSPDSSMAIPAVYACTTVISEDVSTVPLEMFERVNDGKRLAAEHELHELLHDQPNAYQTAAEFREMLTAFALLRGRGIAEKIVGQRSRLRELKPLHPDLVRPEITTDGVLRYRYQDPIKRRERILLTTDVLVVRGRFGRSVLDYARETFAVQLLLQRHASTMYSRGAKPSSALTAPKTLTDNARRNLRQALDEYASGGKNEGRPLLLEEGMSWQSITLSMKDAEFVAFNQLGVAQVARFFRVSLHKIQELSRSTNNNIEQQALEHATDTIRPWAERWEQCIRRDLIVNQRRFLAEHNLEGLLKGDIETRYASYAQGRQWGWLSTNDIRRRENLNPIEGGDDDYLTPLNMTTKDGETRFERRTPQAIAYLRVMVRDAAGRAVRKEGASLTKLAEKTGSQGEEWRAGVEAFYREHGEFVAKLMRIPDEVAEGYAQGRCLQTLEAGLEPDETEAIRALTDLSLQRSDALQLTAGERPQPPTVNVTTHNHAAPVTVQPPALSLEPGAVQVDVHSPVSIDEGAVSLSVATPPVVIEKGAVDVHVEQPKAAGRRRRVTYDDQNRITEVIEE